MLLSSPDVAAGPVPQVMVTITFIINAVLKSLCRIEQNPQSNIDIVIIPEMIIASGDGVLVKSQQADSPITLSPS